MDNVYDAQEASQAALDRQPLDSDWGFCAYGDAPGGIGGGYSAFYWFESREKNAQFHRRACALHESPSGRP